MSWCFCVVTVTEGCVITDRKLYVVMVTEGVLSQLRDSVLSQLQKVTLFC